MKKILLIFALISFSFSITRLQFGTVSIYDLLDDAERNSLSIQIYKHKYNIASAQTRQAWSTVFPKFTFEAGANRMETYSSKAYASIYQALSQNKAFHIFQAPVHLKKDL